MRRPVKYPLDHILASSSGNTAVAIFSFMCTKPTKQRNNHCAVFSALRTIDSFKKNAASDENTSLPGLLIYLDDTDRNGLQ